MQKSTLMNVVSSQMQCAFSENNVQRESSLSPSFTNSGEVVIRYLMQFLSTVELVSCGKINKEWYEKICIKKMQFSFLENKFPVTVTVAVRIQKLIFQSSIQLNASNQSQKESILILQNLNIRPDKIQIRKLTMHSFELSNNLLEFISKMPLLRTLEFFDCVMLDEKALLHLRSSNIEIVKIHNVIKTYGGQTIKKYNFTKNTFHYLMSLPKLTHLHFYMCNEITRIGLPLSLPAQLKSVWFSSCSKVSLTKELIKALSSNYNITDRLSNLIIEKKK